MSKRKYTNIKVIEPELLRMRIEGKTNREIAESLGLELKQVKNWIYRYNRGQARLVAGVPSKRKGRPRRDVSVASAEEYQYESKRLKMENELLWDFLQSIFIFHLTVVFLGQDLQNTVCTALLHIFTVDSSHNGTFNVFNTEVAVKAICFVVNLFSNTKHFFHG